MFRILFIALCALGALSFPAAAQPAAIVVKFSHVVAVDTPKGKAAAYFKKLAEERTHGRVRVEVYPNSSLLSDGEEMEALQLGSVQMLAPSVSKFGPIGLPEFELFDLPYLFSSYAQLHAVREGAVGRLLFDKLKAKGIVGLAFWDNGFKDMSADRPLRRPGDMKGLRTRIQSSRVLDSEMRALGAVPQMMALTEVYPALQKGVVNAVENPPSNFYTQKMYLAQPYLTLTEHGVIEYAVIVNKRFWEGLPADIRETLEGAMRDATKYANDIAKQENDQALAAIRASGRTQVIELTRAEKAAWKQALMGVHKANEANIGRDILEMAYRDAGFTR
jgi:C4-dicarboxylate-binding protein DctP